MQPRREKRTRLELPASITLSGQTMPVLIMDMSSQGIHLRTNGDFPMYRELNMQISISGYELSLSGSVRWNNPIDSQCADSEREVGFSIHSAPAEFYQLLRDLKL